MRRVMDGVMDGLGCQLVSISLGICEETLAHCTQ